jgi:hypothetical protein
MIRRLVRPKSRDEMLLYGSFRPDQLPFIWAEIFSTRPLDHETQSGRLVLPNCRSLRRATCARARYMTKASAIRQDEGSANISMARDGTRNACAMQDDDRRVRTGRPSCLKARAGARPCVPPSSSQGARARSLAVRWSPRSCARGTCRATLIGL